MSCAEAREGLRDARPALGLAVNWQLEDSGERSRGSWQRRQVQGKCQAKCSSRAWRGKRFSDGGAKRGERLLGERDAMDISGDELCVFVCLFV